MTQRKGETREQFLMRRRAAARVYNAAHRSERSAYYAANRERCAERARAYYAKHRDQIRARARAAFAIRYAEKHDAELERARKYYAAHKVECAERKRKWRKAHKAECAERKRVKCPKRKRARACKS